jgi:hypothetical protein
MAEEGKGVALAILGIVAVIAVVGLILLFKGASTGGFAGTDLNSPGQKVYGGGGISRGLNQYESGYERYSSGRVLAGAQYTGNIQHADTGDHAVPEPTIDQDPKRTGSVLNNQCPFPPYTVQTRQVNTLGRECVPSGYNPNTGEIIEIGATRHTDDACCVPDSQHRELVAG